MQTFEPIALRRRLGLPDVPDCASCGSSDVGLIPSRPDVTRCYKCRAQAALLNDTPFRASKLPYDVLNAILDGLQSGERPYHLHQRVGIQYVTAHRIYARYAAWVMTTRCPEIEIEIERLNSLPAVGSWKTGRAM